MLETINGDYEVGPRKHLNQPIQEEFVIVRSGFEILFKDPLGFAHGFESQLPVGHAFPLVAFLAISARRSGADAAWAGSPPGPTGAGLLSTGLGCWPAAMSISDLATWLESLGSPGSVIGVARKRLRRGLAKRDDEQGRSPQGNASRPLEEFFGHAHVIASCLPGGGCYEFIKDF
jgi:hypothetical protein